MDLNSKDVVPEKERKIQLLRESLNGFNTQDLDDDSFLSDQTLLRYLIARNWDVSAAEKQIKSTLEWRLATRPSTVVCTYCQAHPGYHAMRHVGFDRLGRPVIYSNFAQCLIQHNVADDALQHIIFLLENVQRVMPENVYQYVWVMDCTGIKVTSCNPKLAYAVEQVVSNHYPERLGACICVNHGILFHVFWKAVKNFIHKTTANKLHVERSHDKINEIFNELFPDELKYWLYEEIEMNREHPISTSQKEFWKPNSLSHDPRGTESYVKQYLEKPAAEDGASKTYLPHPNIMTAPSVYDKQ